MRKKWEIRQKVVKKTGIASKGRGCVTPWKFSLFFFFQRTCSMSAELLGNFAHIHWYQINDFILSEWCWFFSHEIGTKTVWKHILTSQMCQYSVAWRWIYNCEGMVSSRRKYQNVQWTSKNWFSILNLFATNVALYVTYRVLRVLYFSLQNFLIKKFALFNHWNSAIKLRKAFYFEILVLKDKKSVQDTCWKRIKLSD